MIEKIFFFFCFASKSWMQKIIWEFFQINSIYYEIFIYISIGYQKERTFINIINKYGNVTDQMLKVLGYEMEGIKEIHQII